MSGDGGAEQDGDRPDREQGSDHVVHQGEAQAERGEAGDEAARAEHQRDVGDPVTVVLLFALAGGDGRRDRRSRRLGGRRLQHDARRGLIRVRGPDPADDLATEYV